MSGKTLIGKEQICIDISFVHTTSLPNSLFVCRCEEHHRIDAFDLRTELPVINVDISIVAVQIKGGARGCHNFPALDETY